MSTPTHRSRAAKDARSTGLPTWSGIAIVLAALVTGLLLSVNAQTIGTPYLICFAVAALLVALFTEARGLFLVVASLPLLFGVMTVGSSWAVTRSLAAEGTDAFSTTTILTSLFPLVQYFPALFAVTAATIFIAVGRVWLLRRSGRARDKAAIANRRRTSEADRVNRDTATRARRRTNQVTVDELLARNRSRSETRSKSRKPEVRQPEVRRPEAPRREPRPPRRRRLDDDLYS